MGYTCLRRIHFFSSAHNLLIFLDCDCNNIVKRNHITNALFLNEKQKHN